MTIYIALLRGINVGGHNKIIMVELRNSLEQLGLHNVKTYIQSGNILFESDETEELLQSKIHDKIKADFRVSSVVVIRTAEEIQQIISQSPFSNQEIPVTVRNWKTLMKLSSIAEEVKHMKSEKE